MLILLAEGSADKSGTEHMAAISAGEAATGRLAYELSGLSLDNQRSPHSIGNCIAKTKMRAIREIHDVNL